jgi:hypothetical protein
MGVREIAVRLTLEAAQYLAKDRQVQASVVETRAEMKALDRQVDQTGHEMNRLGVESEKTTKSFRGMRRDTSALDAEMTRLHKHTRELRDLLATTGGTDRSLFRQLRADERDIQRLRRFKQELLGIVPVAANVVDSFGEIGAAVRSGLMGGRAALIGGAIGIGALLAPAIGAAISGAIAGAGIGAAMAGGILSSIKSDRVKSAGKDFLASIEADFFRGGDVFVGPVERSLKLLAADVRSLDLAGVFAKTAPYVEIVAKGIGDLVKNFMPGLSKALDKAGPFSVVFAKGLADTGSALGSFMADVSDSPGALEGLAFTFRVIDGTVVTLGQGLRELSGVFMHLVDLGLKESHAAEDVFGFLAKFDIGPVKGGATILDQMLKGQITNLQAIKDAASATADGLKDYTDDTNHATGATDRFRTALQKENQTIEDSMGLFNDLHGAILAYNQGQADLRQALKENGRTFDENTEAGRKNAAAWQQQLENTQRVRDAEIAAGEDAGKATREYNKQVQMLLDMAAAAGATKAQLDALAKQYVIQIRYTISQTGGIGGIGTSSTGGYDVGDLAHQHMARHAAGGRYPAYAPFVAGEFGPEIVWPGGRGGSVMNGSDTRTYLGGGGGGQVNVRVIVQDRSGRELRQILVNDALGRGKQDTVVRVAYP